MSDQPKETGIIALLQDYGSNLPWEVAETSSHSIFVGQSDASVLAENLLSSRSSFSIESDALLLRLLNAHFEIDKDLQPIFGEEESGSGGGRSRKRLQDAGRSRLRGTLLSDAPLQSIEARSLSIARLNLILNNRLERDSEEFGEVSDETRAVFSAAETYLLTELKRRALDVDLGTSDTGKPPLLEFQTRGSSVSSLWSQLVSSLSSVDSRLLTACTQSFKAKLDGRGPSSGTFELTMDHIMREINAYNPSSPSCLFAPIDSLPSISIPQLSSSSSASSASSSSSSVLQSNSSLDEIIRVPAPHHGPCSVTEWECFGKFLGMCLRTGKKLPYRLSSLFWKALVSSPSDPCNEDDLELLHPALAHHLSRLQSAQNEMLFGCISPLPRWTSFDLFGRRVNITPPSSSQAVTFADRQQYVDMVLHQVTFVLFGQEIEATVRGFRAIVDPSQVHFLKLLSWKDLSDALSEDEDLDLDLMRAATRVEPSSVDSRASIPIQAFWASLQTMVPAARRIFARWSMPNGGAAAPRRSGFSFEVRVSPSLADESPVLLQPEGRGIEIPSKWNSVETARQRIVLAAVRGMEKRIEEQSKPKQQVVSSAAASSSSSPSRSVGTAVLDFLGLSAAQRQKASEDLDKALDSAFSSAVM